MRPVTVTEYKVSKEGLMEDKRSTAGTFGGEL